MAFNLVIAEDCIINCKFCGGEIKVTKPYDSKKIYCNSSCAAKCNNQQRRKVIFCLNCNKPQLKRGPKKFCSVACSKDFQQSEYIKSWLLGEESGLTSSGKLVSVIRRWLSIQSDESCYVCTTKLSNPFSGKSILEVHHINGNYRDNSRENLQLICPNCHAMTETHRALNRGGKGRKYSKARGYLRQ